jgi:hypothetical protein
MLGTGQIYGYTACLSISINAVSVEHRRLMPTAERNPQNAPGGSARR